MFLDVTCCLTFGVAPDFGRAPPWASWLADFLYPITSAVFDFLEFSVSLDRSSAKKDLLRSGSNISRKYSSLSSGFSMDSTYLQKFKKKCCFNQNLNFSNIIELKLQFSSHCQTECNTCILYSIYKNQNFTKMFRKIINKPCNSFPTHFFS